MTAPLPLRREEWPEALREDFAERSAIVWESRGAVESYEAKRSADAEAALHIRRRYAKQGK